MQARSRPHNEFKNSFEKLKTFLLQGQKDIRLSGIKGSFFPYLLSTLSLDIARSFLVVTPNSDLAEETCRELRFYLGKDEARYRPVLFFPGWETLPYDTADPHPEKVIARIESLFQLQQQEAFPIVVTPLPALMQHCISPYDLKKSIFTIKCCAPINREFLLERLVLSGYHNVPLVEERGEFSVRGGIVDIFPPLYDAPIRLELFGDTVDSIRHFNPTTQRSISNREEVHILPVSEIILDELSKTRALEQIELLYQQDSIPPRLRKIVKEKIKGEGHFQGVSFLLQLFYESLGTLIQYCSDDAIVWFYGVSDWEQRVADYEKKIIQSFTSAQKEEKISSLGTKLYLIPEQLNNILNPFTKVLIDSLEIFHPEENFLAFSTSDNQGLFREIMETKSRGRPLAKLVHKITDWLNDYFFIVLVMYSPIQLKRVQDLLDGYELPITMYEDFSFRTHSKSGKGELILTLGKIQRGFCSNIDRVVVLTESELFGEKFSYGKKIEPIEGDPISSLDDLHVEDFVVHVDYGIGQYKGIHSLEVVGHRNDFLLIEYRDQDRLYVPAFRLNLVQKFRSGEEEATPVLNKLGGKTWLNTKNKVKKTIMAHAKELLKIYATRQALEGYSFSPRDQLYREFEAQFEYEETRDQANAIEDVIKDMESPRPMDRLICGDVGYGKTEIALRASFKAVLDNKQVAVLVPTTILAYQHYQTFAYRFRDFPVTVAMLSRFQTHQEQKEVIDQLKEGKLDIVVGTHRLIQKDIDFKELGLVIIDEEHRFGVRHKEKFKKLRTLVDVLTLTATPIPRTLQLSLLGIRDLSIINSPPEDRLAIRTFIAHFDGNIIREAIIREFLRNGQVFFVHNRVENIETVASYLKELVPEANLAVAHGQMEEKELEKVMWAFHQKEINLLLCTTIIESGMDFPNANTIIINRADRLGVAQLYQLRGRVGRSSHQAYAYFLITKESYLTGKAKKRLEIISKFSDLGSGYRLASLDLELRGGGNILGLSQSGHMAQVGIELYYQLIEAAVKEIKGEKISPDVDPEIRLKVSAYLPEDYVPDIHQRLKIYKNLALGLGDEQIKNLKNELRDRFGPLPEVVHNLLMISNIKPALRKYLITSLDFNDKEIILSFHPEAENSLEKVLHLIKQYKNKVKFTPDHKLMISFPGGNTCQEVIGEVKNFLQ
ncbi:MAG TPA: transcription-repair coupling factor [Thermodesulfobacteriota bacterium]|nr:transcription-repair coupling factor [Thermodesulfobacteriota bacterium]